MFSRFSTCSVLAMVLSLSLPPSASAQDGGGGGGGGGGMSGMGGMPAAPRLVQSDVSGPPAADSVRAGLKLDSTVAAGYAAALKLHLAATAALRDSVGRSAEAAGLAKAKYRSTSPLEEQAALGLMLDKLVKRIRKADDDFLDTQVKPLLLKPQWKTYRRWIDDERRPPAF